MLVCVFTRPNTFIFINHGQEKVLAASLAAAADTRKPLESFDKLEQHRRHSPLKVYSPLEVWSDKLDFERQRRHSPLKEWSDKLDAARGARRGSLFDWNGGPDAMGDGMGPNKWPRHVSRQREIQARNSLNSTNCFPFMLASLFSKS